MFEVVVAIVAAVIAVVGGAFVLATGRTFLALAGRKDSLLEREWFQVYGAAKLLGWWVERIREYHLGCQRVQRGLQEVHQEGPYQEKNKESGGHISRQGDRKRKLVERWEKSGLRLGVPQKKQEVVRIGLGV